MIRIIMRPFCGRFASCVYGGAKTAKPENAWLHCQSVTFFRHFPVLYFSPSWFLWSVIFQFCIFRRSVCPSVCRYLPYGFL